MVQSDDGLTHLNPLTTITLKPSGATEATAVTPEAEVTGFGAFREVAFELRLSALSFVGGSSPTLLLEVWVQRKLPSGEWDDLLALDTGAMAAAQAVPVVHVGEYSALAASAPGIPAAIQDGGGSPPFAQRGSWISDALRVKHKITTANSPTQFSATWSLIARGR